MLTLLRSAENSVTAATCTYLYTPSPGATSLIWQRLSFLLTVCYGELLVRRAYSHSDMISLSYTHTQDRRERKHPATTG